MAKVDSLPEIPESLDLDPILLGMLHLAYFLDLAEEDVLDPELAVSQLERVGQYVRRLDEASLEEVEAQLGELYEYAKESGWTEDQRQWLEDFLEYCGIEFEDEEDED